MLNWRKSEIKLLLNCKITSKSEMARRLLACWLGTSGWRCAFVGRPQRSRCQQTCALWCQFLHWVALNFHGDAIFWCGRQITPLVRGPPVCDWKMTLSKKSILKDHQFCSCNVQQQPRRGVATPGRVRDRERATLEVECESGGATPLLWLLQQ